MSEWSGPLSGLVMWHIICCISDVATRRDCHQCKNEDGAQGHELGAWDTISTNISEKVFTLLWDVEMGISLKILYRIIKQILVSSKHNIKFIDGLFCYYLVYFFHRVLFKMPEQATYRELTCPLTKGKNWCYTPQMVLRLFAHVHTCSEHV